MKIVTRPCLPHHRHVAVILLFQRLAGRFLYANSYMQMAVQTPVVLLFVATTCAQFEGKLSLQGSTLCKWYANPEIPEATALQARCAGRIEPPIWHGPGPAQESEPVNSDRQSKETAVPTTEPLLHAEDTKTQKITINEPSLAQQTPAISEKRSLKRKVSETDHEDAVSDTSDSGTPAAPKARRRLLTDNIP